MTRDEAIASAEKTLLLFPNAVSCPEGAALLRTAIATALLTAYEEGAKEQAGMVAALREALDGLASKCGECDGSGVERWLENNGTEEGEENEGPCGYCAGRGVVYCEHAGVPCPRCGKVMDTLADTSAAARDYEARIRKNRDGEWIKAFDSDPVVFEALNNGGEHDTPEDADEPVMWAASVKRLIDRIRAEATEKERERCATIVEQSEYVRAYEGKQSFGEKLDEIAAAIRASGGEKEPK